MKKMSNLSRRMKKRSAQQQSVAEVDVLAETKTRKLNSESSKLYFLLLNVTKPTYSLFSSKQLEEVQFFVPICAEVFPTLAAPFS